MNDRGFQHPILIGLGESQSNLDCFDPNLVEEKKSKEEMDQK